MLMSILPRRPRVAHPGIRRFWKFDHHKQYFFVYFSLKNFQVLHCKWDTQTLLAIISTMYKRSTNEEHIILWQAEPKHHPSSLRFHRSLTLICLIYNTTLMSWKWVIRFTEHASTTNFWSHFSSKLLLEMKGFFKNVIENYIWVKRSIKNTTKKLLIHSSILIFKSMLLGPFFSYCLFLLADGGFSSEAAILKAVCLCYWTRDVYIYYAKFSLLR